MKAFSSAKSSVLIAAILAVSAAGVISCSSEKDIKAVDRV